MSNESIRQSPLSTPAVVYPTIKFTFITSTSAIHTVLTDNQIERSVLLSRVVAAFRKRSAKDKFVSSITVSLATVSKNQLGKFIQTIFHNEACAVDDLDNVQLALRRFFEVEK